MEKEGKMEVLNDIEENNIFESVMDNDTSNSNIVLQDGKNINKKEGNKREICVNNSDTFDQTT